MIWNALFFGGIQRRSEVYLLSAESAFTLLRTYAQGSTTHLLRANPATQQAEGDGKPDPPHAFSMIKYSNALITDPYQSEPYCTDPSWKTSCVGGNARA